MALMFIALLLLPALCTPSSSSPPSPPSILSPRRLADLDSSLSTTNSLLPSSPRYSGEYAGDSSEQTTPLHYPQLLIALPLSPSFNPPPTSFSHDHLFDGDKVSLPSHYWSVIRSLDIPVPWVIKISRQHNHDQYDQNSRVVTKSASTRTPQTYLPFKTTQLLTSPLDFRAPSNYIFLPMWMFRSLGLRPGEIVLAGLAKQVDDGGKVTLRPLTFKESEAEGSEYNSPIEVGLGSDFLKIASPTAVLETSLKHYSTLTAATVISLVYNDKRYYFEVVETRDKRGRVVEAVKVQDCDVQVEFIKGKVVK